MTAGANKDVSKLLSSLDQPNRARAEFKFQRSSVNLEVQMTPLGLLAVGVLVTGILLSVTPIVRAATRHLSAPRAK